MISEVRLVGISFIGGVRRVNGAPAILIGVWVMTIAATLPLAGSVRAMIVRHLGASLEADAVSEGVDYEWMREFAAQATGVGVTLKPQIIGFGAVLDGLSALLDRARQPLSIVLVAGLYLLAWLFLAGGILDRYGRDADDRNGFWTACARFFPRLLRLALVQAGAYALLFGPVHNWLFGRVNAAAIGDAVVDRRTFAYKALSYLIFIVLLGACNLLFDYAKVYAVVAGRRRIVAALRGAAVFIGREGNAAVALYLVDFAAFATVVGVYGVFAPDVGRGWLVWIVIALAQMFVLARLWVKLLFWASEAALFRARQGILTLA